MALAILFGTFAVLLAVGVSVAVSLLAASLLTLLYLGLPADVLVIETAAGTDSSTLLAIPLFVFAGQLMMHGGMSQRLIAFASAVVGHVRGGLGQVNVLSCLLFGGVSGSAIADVSAIGGSMIPQMVERGYDRAHAAQLLPRPAAGRIPAACERTRTPLADHARPPRGGLEGQRRIRYTSGPRPRHSRGGKT